MKHEIDAVWMGNMQFNALVNSHTITMDAPERVGGNDLGPIPKPFVLTALAGCTGMDVVAILRKQGVQLKRFDLNISGELSKQAPMVYTAVHVRYEIDGDAPIQEIALEAVNRSQNELCGVSAMLKKAMPVTWEVNFNGEEIYSNRTPLQAVADRSV